MRQYKRISGYSKFIFTFRYNATILYFCYNKSTDTERCPSGLRCGSRKSVYSNVPWVRIPPSPFLQQKQEVRGMRTTRHSLVEGERERAEGEDLTAKWQSH